MCDHHLALGVKTSIKPNSMMCHGTYSPNDAERCKALDCISQAEDDITQLDKALGHISRILESIKSQRDTRVTDRDTCRALLSPMRRIPNEIWMKILPSAIQGNAEDFSLLQVCRHWTQFLGSIPEAFNRIQLDLTDPEVDRTLYAQLLREYSTRLHGGSVFPRLDIIFPNPWKYCVSQQYNNASDDFVERLTAQLEPIVLSPWWQSITHLRIFNYSPNEWDRVFQRNTDFGAPPRLEHLAIKIDHDMPPHWTPRWDSFFEAFDKGCMNLRSVIIPDEGFHFNGLSVIHLTDTGAAEAKKALSQHSETLTSFTTQSARIGQWPDKKNLTLPHLQHLAIESLNYDIDDLLRTLTCPSLVSLHLCGVLDWEIIYYFIVRSGCSLETFTIGAASMATDRENLDMGLIDVLRSSPSIRRLTYFEPSHAFRHENYYCGYHMSTAFLRSLSSAPYLIPQLEHLITHCPSSQLIDVLTMAESRELKHLGVHLLEFRPVEKQCIVEYYASDMTRDVFDLNVERSRQRNVSVYRVLKSPGIISMHSFFFTAFFLYSYLSQINSSASRGKFIQ